MPNQIISARYAQSFFLLAQEQDILSKAKEDMELIALTCKENKILDAIFNNPNITTGKKKGILSDLFAPKVHKLTLQFILLLIDKRRVILLRDIAQQFGNIYNQYKGIKVALLITAKPIEQALKEKIKAQLASVFSCSIELQHKIDESVLGGFKVMIEDKYYDATLANQLTELRREFCKDKIE